MSKENLKARFLKIQVEKHLLNQEYDIPTLIFDLLHNDKERVRFALNMTETIIEAAELMGVSERTFHRKIKDYNLCKLPNT